MVRREHGFGRITGPGGLLWQELPNALTLLKRALRMCANKQLVIVDGVHGIGGPFERPGLEYMHERFGLRNRVERFFRYLKERTMMSHHKLSAREDHVHEIMKLKQFLTYTHYTTKPQGREAG
jgi:transposase-like protein